MQLYRTKEWEALRSVAHSLKGSAGCFSFEAIHKTAGQLENALRSNQTEQIEQYYNALISALEEAS